LLADFTGDGRDDLLATSSGSLIVFPSFFLFFKNRVQFVLLTIGGGKSEQ
jgi:hypothetical protein